MRMKDYRLSVFKRAYDSKVTKHEQTGNYNLRGSRIELRPHADKLVEVVWAENRLITC